jgi:hypothetical protein
MQNNTKLDRAKQFLPFDALKGYREAIAMVEKQFEEKKELSLDLEERLNEKISQIKKGDNVTVKYYYDLEYIETTGKVKKIDEVYKNITLLNTTISFDDIIDIDLIDK